MKTAVIYARHITYRKYEPTIEEQLNSCKQCATVNNLEITNIYTDLSNKKLQTYEMFEKLKKDCKRLKVETIIIYSTRVLGRNFSNILKFKRNMKKKGIEVIFADINSSPFKETYEFFETFIDDLLKGGDKKWKQQ